MDKLSHKIVSRRGFRAALLLALFAAPGMMFGQAATRLTVTDRVLRKAVDVEPLGLNGFGDVGGTKHSAGNIIFNSGFEPVTMRNLYRVIDSGQDKGRYWVTLDGPGTSNYLLYATGTYSGAAFRAYRFVDAEGKPLPYEDAAWAQGGKVLDTSKGTRCLPLFRTTVTAKGATRELPGGGWTADGVPDDFAAWTALSKPEQEKIAQGWRVYYEGGELLRMDDVVMVQRTFAWPDPAEFHPRVGKGGVRSNWDVVAGAVRQVPLASDVPIDMNGDHGALELTPEGGVAQVWNKLFGGTGREDSFWYSTLDAGVTHRYEAWVKRDGGSTGKVTLGFGGNGPNALDRGYFGQPIAREFDVTEQWQRVGFEFTAPDVPADGGIEGAVIRYAGDGKLLLDNVKLQPVYEPGDADKPFVVHRKLFDELMSTQPTTGRKGAVRIWAGLSQGTMEALCSWTPDTTVKVSSTINVQNNQATTLPKALTILERTGDAPENRAVPWIMTQITHTEDEYRQLIEYLCAPYDAAQDTPQAKPFAFKRFQQRGHGRPWTSDFREIIIEFGNENWHNRAMDDWIGLGRRNTVNRAGRDFGLWGKYMIEQMQQSPHLDRAVIKFCFGGNYSAGVTADGSVTGYGQEATVAAGGANDYHSHATYIGPRWETGEASQTSIDDAGVQKTLLSYRLDKEEEWARQAKAHQRLRKMGFNVRMSAYEGGPSGFGLRAKSKEEDRAGEYYGKSRAMGVAILDAWLDAWGKGWTYQCYLSFGQGRWWNSHTSFANGFRPSPGFLAQTLINRTMANADLVEVTVSGSPSMEMDLPRSQADLRRNTPPKKRSTQLIRAHAAVGGDQTAVAVVNLDLRSAHEVQLVAPFAATSITRYGLTGDPRDTNLDEEKVKHHEALVDLASLANGTLTLTLEPGDVAIIVFHK
ncbi:MAG TPA: hypothetical protein VGN72_13310 [Tepidisphaeraceae bacterium]|jgi:hypothetical protein|nr:hypothetical protein [Tepidisphaeraceae bacterium]